MSRLAPIFTEIFRQHGMLDSTPEWDAMVRERQADELLEEESRDHHIAAQAAEQIANCIPLRQIEREPLEALHIWIGQELLDRDVCEAEANQTALPF